ncbi:MAG: hypothetical protein KA731_02740 [Candidatus Moranbacteria bacterium]|nr:hypothetical protein [Candidatus Moranbacteria bacterium]MBP6034318.1 hypothetical protein [Candidatus Moranbacteria bacterium]
MSLRQILLNRMLLPHSPAMDLAIKDSTVQEADFICPQGFGRNMYSDKNVGAIVGTARKNAGNDIAAFEWLQLMGFNPGRPNKMLALYCIRLSKKEPSSACPVIGQWEVLYAMWLYEPDWYQKYQDIFIPIWPPRVGYLGTRGMMLVVKDIAGGRNLHAPLLVAHPEHIQRCFFIARKIFGELVAADYSDGKTGSDWFDEGSVQRWTRGPNIWIAYEMLVRTHHRLQGWM